MSESRRLKRVCFDRRILCGGVDAIALFLQMADQLPDDAKLISFGESLQYAENYMVFWSSSFDEVDEGCLLPNLILNLRSDYVPGQIRIPAVADIKHVGRPGTITYAAAPTIQGICSCDVAYTGAHRWDCAQGRRS